MNYKILLIFVMTALATTTLSLAIYSSSTFASNAYASTANASSLSSSSGINQQNISSNSSNNTNATSKLKVLVTFEVKEGKKQELLNTIVPLLDSARKEPGNIFFNLYVSTQNPNEILIDQLWSSKAAYDQHHNIPQTVKVNQIITSLAVNPQVSKTYTEINSTR